MGVVSYKCPCCGSPLAFDGETKKLDCASCSNEFELDAVKAYNVAQEENSGEDIHWRMEQRTLNSDEAAQTHSYNCPSCGAELITDATTSATQCAYCGNPAILPSQLTGAHRPDLVVPFKVSKEEATRMFHEYFRGKRLLPDIFLTEKNKIEEIRGLYAPYWLFSCDAHARITYDAQIVATHRQGDYQVTTTDHFLARRAGSLGFDGVPVDGSRKLQDEITEALEPYDLGEAMDFTTACLSGKLADTHDVEQDESVKRANERISQSVQQAFAGTVHQYTSARPRTTQVSTSDGRALSALMPIWLITTKKGKKTYTFAVNGQTGKMVCDVPYSRGKFALWLAGLTAAIGVGGYAVLLLLATWRVL